MVDWIIEIVDWALRLSLWSADWWLLRFFAFTLSILQWQSLNLFQISYFRKSALKKLRVSNIVGKTSCFSVGYQRQFNYLSSCLTSPQHSDHCDDEYRFSHYWLTFSKKAFYLQLRRFTASLVCVIWENRVFCCLSWISCIAYVNFLPANCRFEFEGKPGPIFLVRVIHKTACSGILLSHTLLIYSSFNYYTQSEVWQIFTWRFLLWQASLFLRSARTIAAFTLHLSRFTSRTPPTGRVITR